MKTTYRATFADGTTAEATSARKCNFAWKITMPDGISTGFSISEKAAQQALADCKLFYVHPQDKSKAAEQVRKQNAEYRAACKIEIVPIEG